MERVLIDADNDWDTLTEELPSLAVRTWGVGKNGDTGRQSATAAGQAVLVSARAR